MNYSKQDIVQIITIAVTQLRNQQPMLFSADIDIGERAVSAALQVLLIPHFPSHVVNCEYNRMTDEDGKQIPKRIFLNSNDENQSRVYPDIIIHRQEDGDHNLLVLEIKMSWKNDEKNSDYNKLIGYTRELRFTFGLYLELNEEGIAEMSWFKNGEPL